MLNPRLLAREPALIIDALETGLVLLVALGLHLSGTTQTDIVAAVIAGAGVVKAITTNPWPVTLFTDLGRAALVLAADFGLNLPPDKIAVAVTFIGTFMTLVQSIRITPNTDPVFSSTGAGAGPVMDKNAAGYTTLGTLGMVLLLLALVLVVLNLATHVAVGWVFVVVLAIVGVGLLVLDGR